MIRVNWTKRLLVCRGMSAERQRTGTPFQPMRWRLAFLCQAMAFLMLSSTLAKAQDDPQQPTPIDRAAFGELVREYLLAHPEVIVEALQRYAEPAEAENDRSDFDLIVENAEEIFYDATSWVGGNPDGDVTLVEFVDYRCGFCRRVAPDVKEVVETDGNVRFVVKEFPILGEQSEKSARLAIAVLQLAGPKAYGEIHDYLIQLESPIDSDVILDVATRTGLDPDELSAHASDEGVAQVIRRNYALANALNIQGTPAFVIGGQLYRGALSLDDLGRAVQIARRSAEQADASN